MIVPGGGISLDGKRWVACRPGIFQPAAAHSHTPLAEAQAFAAYLTPLRSRWSTEAQAMLRSKKWSWLKAWAMQIARRRGMKKAIVALARRLAVIMHRIWVDGTEFRWTREQAPAAA